ncbi:MAG: zinc-binding dehydrogenase [Spirochaetia bacterium]|jgi:threonine dehydrogenase-like Zn-dependent dehydrogenase
MLSVAVMQPGRIEIVDIPKPAPGPYEAIVRNQVAFICNATDRKVVGGHFPGLGPEKFPLLLGHESVGVVESVGARVRSFKPGDRVIGGLLLSPTDPRFTSGWGGNSEYVVATDHAAMVADGVADKAHGWDEIFQIMRKLPGDIPLEEAALLCTWREVYAGFGDFQLRPGDDILIFGGGPVGLSFCRFARILGMGWIGLVDPLPFKRERAKAMGADETFAPDAAEVKNLVERRGKPLDTVIDAVGSERVINAGLPLLRLAGSLCVYGVLGTPTITIAKETGPLNFNLFVHQWPTRTAEAAAQEPLVEWIRAGKLSSRDFLSAEYPVREASRALAATEQPTAIKTLLRF